ncbi:hypothetical protein [Burkholderia sp. Bp9143]|uniref:hypothetical protein n=1 Tax=Burkholderia sp. Bp9143 TaxID=2184574 RepID=UPI001625DD34|nr:hypothetical protein [Burkholderia sp. Bp9143]
MKQTMRIDMLNVSLIRHLEDRAIRQLANAGPGARVDVPRLSRTDTCGGRI